jgi:phosphatidylglycerophosphatase A
MAWIPFSLGTSLAGFLFFRLFDIIKPPPAGRIDRRMNGGFAVVLDDAVAGLYANLAIRLLLWGKPEFFPDTEKWLLSLL